VEAGASSQQQQDWSVIYEYFDAPHTLFGSPGGGLSKAVLEVVRNAVSEMRRYYSRKVVDVLIRVTRHSLDVLRRRFSLADTASEPTSGDVNFIYVFVVTRKFFAY
jgi:dynein heavy chain